MTSPDGQLPTRTHWLNPYTAAVADKLIARPRLALMLALAVGAGSVAITTGLAFDTRLSALLPQSAPEVRELEQVEVKAGGTVQLVVAIGGPEAKRLPFARELVRALRKQDWIRWADVEFPVDFFLDRRAWMLSAEQLEQLRKAIADEIDQAKARANPLYVDLEEDEDEKKTSPWAEVDRRTDPSQKRGLLQRTFSSPDKKYLFVRAKPNATALDMGGASAMVDRTQALVDGLDPAKRGLEVRFAGGLIVNKEQHERMKDDMRRASIYALALVLLLTTLYIRRLAAMIVLAAPLVIGVAVTLAITTLTIGQLNLVSGFLVSALIGLGIAFGVHLYMRYLEYQAVAPTREYAMRQAIVNTFPGCFTAAATTAAAFYAMTISDFRGFREYGQIAGGGVLLTLVATFLVLPPLALLLSARSVRRSGWSLRIGFSRRFAAAMVITGLAFVAFSIAVWPQVGWRNNFKELRGKSDAVAFYEYVQDALGGSLSPAAVMVDNVAQAAKVEQVLEPYMKGDDSPITRAISLASMVPTDVPAKRKVLGEIEKLLLGVLKEKLAPEDKKRVKDALALVTAEPWTVEQIPEVFRRQFFSIDGKNAFVVVWPRSELYVDAELFQWAETLDAIGRELKAAGINATMLDENRIAARVVREVRREWPKVFAYAGIAVLLILALDFRSPRKVALLGLSLGIGLVWIVGGMYVTDVPLNIFNQSVLPTVLGIGIDNAVHVQHRYDLEGPGSISRVITTTGAAALLASATSAIGFGTTITAHHYGMNTLGWLAIVGISATFIGSTVFFPSVLRLLERKK